MIPLRLTKFVLEIEKIIQSWHWIIDTSYELRSSQLTSQLSNKFVMG